MVNKHFEHERNAEIAHRAQPKKRKHTKHIGCDM